MKMQIPVPVKTFTSSEKGIIDNQTNGIKNIGASDGSMMGLDLVTEALVKVAA